MLKIAVILLFLNIQIWNALFIGVSEVRFSFLSNYFIQLQQFQFSNKSINFFLQTRNFQKWKFFLNFLFKKILSNFRKNVLYFFFTFQLSVFCKILFYFLRKIKVSTFRKNLFLFLENLQNYFSEIILFCFFQIYKLSTSIKNSACFWKAGFWIAYKQGLVEVLLSGNREKLRFLSIFCKVFSFFVIFKERLLCCNY